MELDSVKQTARLTEEHVCSVLNCLNSLEQDSGPTEIISEAPGLYGIRNNTTWIALFEAASALASRPSHEMG